MLTPVPILIPVPTSIPDNDMLFSYVV